MPQTSWLMRLLPLFLTFATVGGALAVAFS
jgi:hypothetical protein